MQRIEVGGYCKRGHEIRSEADLVLTRIKNRHGLYREGRRCRKCKQDADAGRIEVGRLPRGPKRDKWKNILDKGICRSGHEIKSEDDYYIKSCINGNTNMYCVHCRDAGRTLARPSERQHVLFTCGCERIFEHPVPEVRDDIYCIQHQSAEKVAKWLFQD